MKRPPDSDRAVDCAAEVFVAALSADPDEAGELAAASGDRLFDILRMVGGVVVVDGEEHVKRSVLAEVREDVLTRVRTRLASEPSTVGLLEEAIAVLEGRFPIRH
jgi:hypothetical protein